MLIAPEAFDKRDEDGVVVLLDAERSAGQHEAVREAAVICPAAVIEVDA
ncbi:ferredoxin [Streptomyces decoyicus]|nr:ferredoxin [Streptomyces decoyicus]KOG43870.1 ferredoxin [Streptomyces decoyicus]QZY19189.1 ferredoxin [Streptomyces decoyicus]